MRILVANAGSSSMKLRLLDPDDRVVAEHDLDAPGGRFDDAEVKAAIDDMGRAIDGGIDAVGHRVVQGAHEFTGPVRIDEDVLRRLRDLTALAPLHQPAALSGIDTVHRALPDTPGVACFDTSFHADLPDAARTYAIPEEWRNRFGLRRFGFHGLSYAYATGRVGALLRADPDHLRIHPNHRRLVICHLGAGASIAAVRGDRAIDTTMGFTPLEGLVMATRSGSVDPGMLVWLQREAGIPAAELDDALQHRSGLSAFGTADMRTMLSAAESGDGRARLAIDVYVHRLRGSIAGMTAALGGLDALVFTGRIGERAPEIRARAADGLRFLGVTIDPDANRVADGDADITAEPASVRTFVIVAREELQIAKGVRQVLGRA